MESAAAKGCGAAEENEKMVPPGAEGPIQPAPRESKAKNCQKNRALNGLP